LRLALSVCVLTVKRFAESPLKRGVSDSEPRQHFTMNAFCALRTPLLFLYRVHSQRE
jgi:hypothetical protein